VSIKNRLLIIVIPAVLIVGALQGYFSYQGAKEEYKEGVEQGLKLINKKILYADIENNYNLLENSGLIEIEAYVQNYKNSSFKEIDCELEEFPDIRSAVLDKKGNLLYSHNINSKAEEIRLKMEFLEGRLGETFPVYAIDRFEPWALTLITYETKEEIGSKFFILLQNTLLTSLVGAFIVALLIIYFSNRMFILPISLLKQNVSRMSVGDEVMPLSFDSEDEIASLAKDTQNMYLSIKEKQKDLEWEIEVNRSLADVATKLIDKKNIDSICSIILEHAVELTKSKGGFVVYEGRKIAINKPEIRGESIFAPVLYGDRTLGKISLSNPLSPYEEKHKKALEHLALLMSIALNKFEMGKKEKEQERMLIEQSKLAAMGQMMGAIAHQWKQPVNVISLTVENLIDSYDGGALDREVLKSYSKIITNQITYMSQTIQDFRDFLKPSREKSVFMPCESVSEVVRLINPQLKKHSITVHIAEHEHCKMLGYPNEFKQALMNIFINAKDAMVGRGVQEGKIEVSFFSDKKSGTIRIKDNGGGIDPSLLPDKLFDSYTSTKGEEGTGLGLQIVKSIIESRLGGKIYARNVEGGAEFVIELPLIRD